MSTAFDWETKKVGIVNFCKNVFCGYSTIFMEHPITSAVELKVQNSENKNGCFLQSPCVSLIMDYLYLS